MQRKAVQSSVRNNRGVLKITGSQNTFCYLNSTQTLLIKQTPLCSTYMHDNYKPCVCETLSVVLEVTLTDVKITVQKQHMKGGQTAVRRRRANTQHHVFLTDSLSSFILIDILKLNFLTIYQRT